MLSISLNAEQHLVQEKFELLILHGNKNRHQYKRKLQGSYYNKKYIQEIIMSMYRCAYSYKNQFLHFVVMD